VRPGQALLEIGPGNGFTSGYLRGQGFEETTLDVGPGKHPDIVAGVAAYDLPGAYDAVLAREVFASCGFRIELRRTSRKFRFYALRAPRREPAGGDGVAASGWASGRCRRSTSSQVSRAMMMRARPSSTMTTAGRGWAL